MDNDVAALDGKELADGWRFVAVAETDSTNDENRRRAAAEGGREGLVIVAGKQTRGRGRRGRPWVSPEGNVYLSVRLDQASTLGVTAQVSYVAAVALADSLALVAPHLSFRLKWPNDVLVNGGKVSGILLETDGPQVIVGVGVNVRSAPPAPDALYPPTSLRAEGALPSQSAVAYRFVVSLQQFLRLWRDRGMAALRPYWMERALGVGGRVTARLQNGDERQGTFVDLDADGAMILRRDDGRIDRITAGDVFFAPG